MRTPVAVSPAADRSPSVQRSRERSARQTDAITRAAQRLIEEKGTAFTTRDLAKESGVALQTVYRHFTGKDQVLLAVVESVIAERAARLEAAARPLPDPVARLRFYVTAVLASLRDQDNRTGPRFITAEHWRLLQLFPDDMERANQPFAALVERELREAAAAGLLEPGDPAGDAWLVMKLVMSVYHHYAFATPHRRLEDVAEHLWQFCLAAFGGAQDARDARVGEGT